MKKYKVKNLIGAKLDAAVAKAEGKKYGFGSMRGAPGEIMCFIEAPVQRYSQTPYWFAPSTLWSHGGPIIERERVVLVYADHWRDFKGWMAFDYTCFEHVFTPTKGEDETPLIAAMRAFVAIKLGDEVEL